MNFFKKFKLINKVSNTVKEIKAFLNKTHLDEEIKEDIENIVNSIQKLVKKYPELKNAYLTIIDIIK